MSDRLSLPAALVMACLLAGGAVTYSEAVSTYDLRVVSHQLPVTLESGTRVDAIVTLANDGAASWDPNEGFAVSFHWFDADGAVVQWDGPRTALPSRVRPGDRVTLAAAVEVPKREGPLELQWDVVQEGVRWLSQVDPTPPATVPVKIVAAHAFEMPGRRVPRVAVAASRVHVELRIRNAGSGSWRDDGSFALSSHWLRRDGTVVSWEGPRAPISSVVPPGGITTLAADLVVPGRPGLYRLQWDMVEEGVCWFSERDPSPPAAQTVVVLPDPLRDPLIWALCSLLGALATVLVMLRGRPQWLVIAGGTSDLLWLVGGLVVKQQAVLAAAGVTATAGGLLMTAAGAALAALLVVTLPGFWRGRACWLIALAATFLLWVDVLYLRFFGDLPGPWALQAAGQVDDVAASVWSLMAVSDLWLWLDLAAGGVIVAAARKARERAVWRVRRLVVITLVTVSVAGAGAALQLRDRQPALFEQVFRRLELARHVGVINLQALEAVQWTVGELQAGDVNDQERAELAAWFEARAPSRAGVGPWFGAAAGRSLVMVQVESLQGFVIGLEVGGEEVTPFLNAWRSRALWFSNVTDQTLEGRSSDSELASQTSLLPATVGAAAFRFAANDYTGVAEILVGRGYRTLSAVPYEGDFWNRRATHRSYGFQTSLFRPDFAAGEQVGWGLSDRDFLGQMVPRLHALPEPYAAYLLTLSLHHPFEGFPEHLKELDVGRWQGTPFGSFLHTMHYFDASLAEFVAALDAGRDGIEPLIAVWGDHDAGFEWRPEIAAAMGVSSDPAGWYLSQEVPLFVRVPGVAGLTGERTVPAGHTDIAPTLLALLGVDPAPYAFVGRNLLGTPGTGPVVGEYGCWRDDQLLFLQGDGSLGGGRCLELATMRPVRTDRCAAGWEAARRVEKVSAEVLQNDLQTEIHRSLAAPPGGRQ